jgi:hypothetical protein
MIVAIHQPNFFPWLPFFEKVKQADVFVVLKHCQFEKNNYQNRFEYQGRWHTMSVNKGLEPIERKTYVSYEKDWAKIKANLRNKKAALKDFDECFGCSLYETNHAIILKAMQKLEINTRVECDWPTELVGTDRLVDICKAFNASTYLAGQGGKKYMDLSKFEEAGIKVEFQTVSSEQSKHILDIL